MGFGKKLERIIPDRGSRWPITRVITGFRQARVRAGPGPATVDLRASRERLEALAPQAERYLGKVVWGPVWDRLLHEHYDARVFVDIAVRRAAVWPDLSASRDMEVTRAAWPGSADP